MFLKKIIGIKAVGRFRTGGISGGEYGHFTLFYGGNGRGKTTICSILRSFQENDPSYIEKRKTFKSSDNQEVHLLLDTGPVRFKGGAWSAASTEIHIFDQHFINANVHGGHQIDIEQRRNFYRVVVGPQGVKLAEEIDKLDEAATAKQQQITAEKKVLQQHVPNGMTLEKFLKLNKDSEIDDKIAVSEKELKAIESSDIIAKQAALTLVTLPKLPENFEELMAKGLSSVSADASARIHKHMEIHKFHANGENWISEGLGYVHEGKCPFCSSSVEGNTLVEAYTGYFSKAYKEHQKALQDLKATLSNALGEAAALKIVQGFDTASHVAEFWRQFTNVAYKKPNNISDVSVALKRLFDAANDRLTAKISAPLEEQPASASYEAAATAWQQLSDDLESANNAIAEDNKLITAIKEKSGKTNKQSAATALAALKAIKARHSEPFTGLASAYEMLIAEKDKIVSDKEAKKSELNSYDAAIFSAYEAEINSILSRFNAGFRLTKCGKNYVGKTPQSEYCLQFDGNDIDVSKPDGPEPSFDTTMSAGDKSTFALAFFLAQLNRDPNIGNKLVVFDDPFTSLDDFRREMTAKAIVRVGSNANQVIVFSHDKHFLDAVRQKIHGLTCVAMQIAGAVGNSSLSQWDIDREVKEGYLTDHLTISEYVGGVTTDAKPIRTLMRPLIEKYIRYRFPNQILEGKWLGDMLTIIRADPNHPLTPQYQDLDDVNEYTAPFHHDPNTPFNDAEVMAHAKLTLKIVGGC